MSMYEQIKQLYAELNQGNLNKAREIMSALVKKGMNKTFMAEMCHSLAKERMVEILYDEVVGALKK